MWKRARSYRALGHLADVPVDQLLLLRGCDRGVAWQVVTRSPRGTRRGRLPGKEGSVSGGRRGGQAPLRMLHKRHHRRLRGNDDVDPSFNEELRVAAAEYHHVGTGVGRPRGPTHTRPWGRQRHPPQSTYTTPAATGREERCCRTTATRWLAPELSGDAVRAVAPRGGAHHRVALSFRRTVAAAQARLDALEEGLA